MHFNPHGVRCIAIALLLGIAQRADAQDIQLRLRPKLCTLAAGDTHCETEVSAEWRSPQLESLCLLIANRSEVTHCWENYSEGIHKVKLVFDEDLLFELRDPPLKRTLASQVLRVIRETIEYRRKRRQPWNILY